MPASSIQLQPMAEWYCLRANCVKKRNLSKMTDRGPLTDLWWDVHRLKHNSRRVDYPCQLPLQLILKIRAIEETLPALSIFQNQILSLYPRPAYPRFNLTTTQEDTLISEEIIKQAGDRLIEAASNFDITAQDMNGQIVTEFEKPFTFTVVYQDEDWQSAGLQNETDLEILWWNGTDWESLLPCDGCSPDPERNQFIVQLNHLSRFALAGRLQPQQWKVYSPLVER